MMIKKKLREFRYRLFSWRRFPQLVPSDEPIDVVIPIIEKDLNILPLCLEGVRNCVNHKIKDIYIVAPDSEKIKGFCSQNNLKYVEESTVLGFTAKDLNLIVHFPGGGTRNRSGWIFQQFIKLSGKVGTCRHYLCIDADHVLIRPHTFLTDKEKTVFYLSYEVHPPYYENIHRLMPEIDILDLSYVDHKMLFSKDKLEELHRILEQKSGKDWITTIMDSLDRTTQSAFSEFELYGNFVQDKELRPWLQKRLPYSKLDTFENLRKKYSGGRWSLTFPDYMRQNKNVTCKK